LLISSFVGGIGDPLRQKSDSVKFLALF
jgi:hypothetical protein